MKSRVCLVLFLTLWTAGRAQLSAQEESGRNFHEYELWHQLTSYDLSADGEWVLWTSVSRKFVDSLYVRGMRTGRTYAFASGSMPEFSDDSRWLAFSMPDKGVQEGGVAYQTCLLELGSGELKKFSGVESFSFTSGSCFLILKGRSETGTALSLYDLKEGRMKTLPPLYGYVLDPGRHWMAYTVQQVGGGKKHLEIMNLVDFHTVCPDIEDDGCELLDWGRWGLTTMLTGKDSCGQVCVNDIRVLRDIAGRHKTYSLADVCRDSGVRLNRFYRPRWSADGKILFFGTVREVERGTPSLPNVTVWHWKDDMIQSEQKNRYYENRSKADLCAWWPEQGRWGRISGGSSGEAASISPSGRHVLVVDDRPYRPHFREARRDWYLVEVETGEKTKLLENTILTPAFSPCGSYVYYFKDENWWVYDVSACKHVNVTQGIGTGLSDRYYDGPIDIAPSFGFAGWSGNDREFWVYDQYDVWSVDVRKKEARRLTEGRENRTVFRVMGKGEMALDRKLRLSAKGYDGRTGVYGYDGKGGFIPMVYGPYRYGRIIRSDVAGTCLYTRESNITSEELFYTDDNFLTSRSVVRTQVRNSDSMRFTASRLVRYRNSKGEELKGALFYPVNYEKGRKYPMVVKMYENLSRHLNTFVHPSAQDAYNTMNFVLQGYFVLMPDIRYEVNRPGESAVDCITSAVRSVLGTGIVDPDAIGLLGHSWGAYQAAYIISQTDMFAAAVAGAPLTDMVSMYNSIYWENGRSNQEMFETGQARFRKPFWEIPEAFFRNSPVFQAGRINTPLLMICGTEDKAVDWRQGLELYITMRRMGKPCILLSYEGEGHTISLEENEKDQTERVLDFFDCWLKGAKPKAWISNGVRYRMK